MSEHQWGDAPAKRPFWHYLALALALVGGLALIVYALLLFPAVLL